MPPAQWLTSSLLTRISLSRQRFQSSPATQAVNSNADRCRLEPGVPRLRTILFPRKHWNPSVSLFDQTSEFHSPKSLNARSGLLKNSAACFCEIQNRCPQQTSEFATYAVESARCQLVARGILGASDRSRIESRYSLLSVFGIVPNRFEFAGPWLRMREQPMLEG